MDILPNIITKRLFFAGPQPNRAMETHIRCERQKGDVLMSENRIQSPNDVVKCLSICDATVETQFRKHLAEATGHNLPPTEYCGWLVDLNQVCPNCNRKRFDHSRRLDGKRCLNRFHLCRSCERSLAEPLGCEDDCHKCGRCERYFADPDSNCTDPCHAPRI